MNESTWQSSLDGEAMLEHVADRLSARQWALLSTAYVRKLWDLLPDGVLRQAVEFVEHGTHPLPAKNRTEWIQRIDGDLPLAVSAAELAQHEIVKSCDPDAAELDRPILARPNQIAPAFPLFQASSRNARSAIEGIGTALTEAAQAVRSLFAEPNEEMLAQVREHTDEAAESRTNANRMANNALRMKAKGDEIADESAGAKNKRLFESIALEEVRKIEEGPRQHSDEFEAEEKRDRATRKQLAQFLRELVGNPFSLPRFEANWRTSTVVQLAQGIFEERAFDRMPILADALLDADCDEEAILRHSRGTELHNRDQPYHIRGCWVVELILQRFEQLPPPNPEKKPGSRRRHFDDLDIGLPFDLGDDRLA